MIRFDYTVKDLGGKTIRGQVEAALPHDAARLLRDKGYVVISIKPQKASLNGVLKRITERISLSDVSVFTRQFATMITAGLPITEALVIMKSQARPGLKPVIDAVLADVEGGSSLSGALEKHTKVFTGVYVALIKAGEGGGILDQILTRLADNLESQREFQAKVKGALIYPVIVIIGMLIVSSIMIIFVIPKLLSLFQEFEAELPLATKVLISISTFAVTYWWAVLIFIVAVSWFLLSYSRTALGRERLDGIKLKIPVFGPLEKQVMLTEFSRTLGLLVGAGVSILEGLRIVSGVVNNSVVASSVRRSSIQVEQGFSLAYAFSQEPEIFPPMLYQMLAVGEETGKMDESLLKVSRVFEQESEHLVKGLTAAIEPIIMIILGLGVGFLVIAVIMPIYNLTGKF